MRISHRLVPLTAWRLEIPRMAISEDVSKPSPKTKPRGYSFQGRSMALNSLPNTLVRTPPPSTANWSPAVAGAPSSVSGSPISSSLLAASTFLNRRIRRYRTHALPMLSATRNTALTAVPIMLPTREKPSKRLRRAPLVAATTMQVMMTTVLWPREKNVPTDAGRWPDAISRRVVRSMAAMWSASRPWRRPSVYDRAAGAVRTGCVIRMGRATASQMTALTQTRLPIRMRTFLGRYWRLAGQGKVKEAMRLRLLRLLVMAGFSWSSFLLWLLLP